MSTTANYPSIIFGSSALGNLYEAISYEEKLETARQWMQSSETPVIIDSAGKYGAGLALEMIGQTLRELKIPAEKVILSNKLGWKRRPLKPGTEPTFEPGVWKELQYDAEYCISYEGIMECYHEGNALLGAPYKASMVSIHDPDEHLISAKDEIERQQRMGHILEAYRALHELKAKGEVQSIGVGSKNWRIAAEISREVKLDWVMLACVLTPYCHEPDLLEWLDQAHTQGIKVINSAVFHGGFLMGGSVFDYKTTDPIRDAQLYEWRDRFFKICAEYKVKPAHVCIQFGLQWPAVVSTALNTSRPQRIPSNIAMTKEPLPPEIWSAMKNQGLIQATLPFI